MSRVSTSLLGLSKKDLAYIDVFVALGMIAAVMVPLALTLRSVNRSAGAKPAH